MPSHPTNRSEQAHSFHDRILSLPEAAHITGVSVDTLRRCNARHELLFIRLSPRRIGIRLSDLRSFLNARSA